MKRILVLVVLATVGLVVAGCGSAKKSGIAPVVINTIDTKSPSGTIVVKGTKTFANLPVGTPIACGGGAPIVNVPSGATSIGAVRGPEPAARMKLSRSLNGAVTVSCSRK